MQAEGKNPEEARIYINWIYGIANAALRELLKHAFSGNELAALGLLKIIETNLSALDELCHKNPDLFEPIARNKLYWPAFISDLIESKERNKKLLAMLNLGKDYGLNTSGNQPDWDLPEIKVAMWLHEVAKLSNRMGRLNKETVRISVSSKLQPLNRDNYGQWFEASWPLFIARHGEEFQDQKCFAHLVASAEKMSLNEKKKRRGILRKYIKKRILSAFRQIAQVVDLKPT